MMINIDLEIVECLIKYKIYIIVFFLKVYCRKGDKKNLIFISGG